MEKHPVRTEKPPKFMKRNPVPTENGKSDFESKTHSSNETLGNGVIIHTEEETSGLMTVEIYTNGGDEISLKRMERHLIPTEEGKSEIPLKQSPLLAEFFAENKITAGFENPGKSLYTTVTQLVENALDSAESIQEFPRIEVTIEDISRSKNNSMAGCTVKDSEKGKKVKKGKKGPLIYRVTCKDNGRGMTDDDIVDMFGGVFCSTKCRVKQTREKSALGTKMALIWSKISTGSAVDITTSLKDQDYKTHCLLDIDVHGPKIHQHRTTPADKSWHGAEIKVEVEGNWGTYGSEIMEYMQLMAVITPYAEFTFQYVSAIRKAIATKISYPRRREKLPPVPVEGKYHPSAVDLSIIGHLIRQTENHNLLEFLQHEFSNICKAQAERLIGEMGPGVTSKTQVTSLTIQQFLHMHQLLQEAEFSDPPTGDCLIPVGEYNLFKGIYDGLLPTMVTSHSDSSARVYRGHPFIIEAAVSLGGDYFKKGLNIFRFANRVPLLFKKDADVVTTATKRINWGNYGIKVKSDRIGVFVSIVSTKIPFQGAGMEYIGDDTGKIADAVQTLLEEICISLKGQLEKKQKKLKPLRRQFILDIPHLANCMYQLRREEDTHITEESLRLGLRKMADKMDF